MLEVDQVTKIYPSEPPVTALRGVTFSVGQGELVGIVGPSGSGKTTLLAPDGHPGPAELGHVRITGLDVARCPTGSSPRCEPPGSASCSSSSSWPSTRALLDNVADGLLYAGVRPVERRARAARRPGHGRARIAGPRPGPPSCQAGSASGSPSPGRWSASPAIVLADEPTGNLDQATGQAILALLEELHGRGATIVVITHDRDIAARMPRQIEMLDGRIVADTHWRRPRLSRTPASAARPDRRPGCSR